MVGVGDDGEVVGLVLGDPEGKIFTLKKYKIQMISILSKNNSTKILENGNLLDTIPKLFWST